MKFNDKREHIEKLEVCMEFEKEKMRQIRKIIIWLGVVILLLIYSKEVFRGLAIAFNIMKPFIYGGIIAFILNLPLRFVEEKLFARWTGKSAAKYKRPVSIFLSILLLCGVITLVVAMVVPQVMQTIVELGNKIPPFIEQTLLQLKEQSVNYPEFQQYLEKLDLSDINLDTLWNNLLTFAKSGMTSMLTSTFSMATSIVGGIVNGLIALIFSLYILGQKEKLADQSKRILSAYASDKWNARILKVCSMLYRNFSNFISGQCLEAVILGTMFVITMTILGMPYAVLVGMLISFTALIPIVGAFIGCFVGTFLILVDTPQKALWFIILFLVLQQIEGNLIYPKVVGSSVGLPPIWVLMAVSVGGSLFGIFGMLSFIPLVSTFYMLLRDDVNERNEKKKAVKKEGRQK